MEEGVLLLSSSNCNLSCVAAVLAVDVAVAVTVTVVAGSAGGRVCCGGTWV